MLRALHATKPAGIFSRVLVDFLIIQLSMILAVAVSLVYQLVLGNTARAVTNVEELRHYFFTFFWLLSPIFPLVFLFSGFYTHSRSYMGKYKTWVILKGVGVALMLFIAANFLLLGRNMVGRAAVVAFAVLAAVGLSSVRLLKCAFEKRYRITPNRANPVPEEAGHVLVVGGAGYIGTLLVERLLRAGRKVRILDNLTYGAEGLRTLEKHPDLELMLGDCRNIQDVVKAVNGVDSIIDLAAIVGDPACEQDRGAASEINYAATRMLVEIAKGHGISRFLFASSCSVYGATDLEVDENSAVNPISLYGQTKVDSEQALLRAASKTFHPTVLRFATVFGLGYRPRFDLVVNLLTAKAWKEGVMTIYNGEQWRPFIHIRDIVEAIFRVLEAPANQISAEIFNVGDSRLNHTLAEVAEVIRGVFPEARVENVENTDRRNYRVNFDKLQNRLGFRAQHTLRDGVEELKRAFDEGLITDYTDLRYHNQRFLAATGSPGNKDEIDGLVMAAFATPPRVKPRTFSAAAGG
jgi:nucleoside-diphosphate-sugar epimerase